MRPWLFSNVWCRLTAMSLKGLFLWDVKNSSTSSRRLLALPFSQHRQHRQQTQQQHLIERIPHLAALPGIVEDLEMLEPFNDLIERLLGLSCAFAICLVFSQSENTYRFSIHHSCHAQIHRIALRVTLLVLDFLARIISNRINVLPPTRRSANCPDGTRNRR